MSQTGTEDSPRQLPDIFVVSVQELHGAAGQPTLRQVESATTEQGYTISRTTIGRMLNGTANPRWKSWRTLICALVELAVEAEIDPSAETARLLSLWRQGNGAVNLRRAEVEHDEGVEKVTLTLEEEREAGVASQAHAPAATPAEFVMAIDVVGEAAERPAPHGPGDVHPAEPSRKPTVRLTVLLAAISVTYGVISGSAADCVTRLLAASLSGNRMGLYIECIIGLAVGMFAGAVLASFEVSGDRAGKPAAFGRFYATLGLAGLVGLLAGAVGGGDSHGGIVGALLIWAGCGSVVGLASALVMVASMSLHTTISSDDQGFDSTAGWGG